MRINVLNILLIDENIKDAALIEKHLSGIKELSINLEHITQLEEAHEYLLRLRASIILLALNKSGVNELEKISRLRNIAPFTPIIVLSESDVKEFSLQSISAGADDYLLKDSLNTELTLKTFRYTIEKRDNSERVKESEKRYEELVTLLPQIVFEMDAAGYITYVNAPAFKVFGYNKDILVNRIKAVQMFEEKDRARALQNIQNALKGEVNTGNEYCMLKSDGSTFQALIFSNTIVRNGAILGLRGIMIDITEGERSGELLKSPEEKFNRTFQSSPLAMTIQNSDDQFIDVNEAFLRMTEYSREEIIGHKGSDLNLWADQEERKWVQNHYRLNESFKDFEFSFRKRSGKIGIGIIWSEKIIINGKTAVLTTSLDITECKKAEKDLFKNEARTRAIVEGTPYLFFYTQNANAEMTYVSPTVEQITGYSIEKWLHTKDWFITESKINQYAKERTYAHLRGEFTQGSILLEVRHARGHKLTLEIFENPVFQDGKVIGLQGVAHDITARKNAELALENSEKRYRDLFNNNPQPMWAYDLETLQFIEVNDAAIDNYGYSRDEFLSMTIKDIRPEEDVEKLLDNVRTSRKRMIQNVDHAGIWRHRKKDGTIISVEITSHPLIFNNREAELVLAQDVTKKLEAENKLIESEKRYREVVEEATEIIYTTDEKGNLTYVNPAVLKATGYTIDDLLNKNYLDFTLPNYRRRIFSTYFRQIKEKLENTYMEYPFYTKEGAVRWFGQNVRLIIENGIVKGFYVIARDITERIEAEEKIMLLSRAVEKSPASIMITDETGNIEYVNPKFTDLTGYTFEEVKGKNPRLLKSGEKSTEEYKSLWETIKSGKEWRGEFHNKKKNGELYWESVSIAPIKNGKTFFLAVKEDITERKKSEERILLLANAIESVSECITITDMKDKILFTNNAFRTTYGYTEEELIGRNISLVRSKTDVSIMTQEILPKTIDGGWQGEVMNRRKDGSEFPVYLSTAMIKDETEKPVALIGVANDITERMRIHKELIEAKEKAEKSDKLKSEFLAQMSHEIRTPLNILLSYSAYIKEVLEERHHLSEDLYQYFSTASDAGKRIIRTIELILNMSDLKSGSFINDPKLIDVYEDILKQVFHQFYHSVDVSKIKFDLIQKSDSLFSNIDPYAVEQVFIHIIDNAIKFTEKGHILIHAGKNQMGNTVIKIEDTGAGIGKEYMKLLYTPFTQEDHGYTRSFDGNGLGLALVKKYCELNNIKIEVQSEKWKGSVFTLTFPG